LDVIDLPVGRLDSPEIETSSMDWAQLSRLVPEDEGRMQSPERCVLNKNNRRINNAQKLNNYTELKF
jgi:hypothetical protein